MCHENFRHNLLNNTVERSENDAYDIMFICKNSWFEFKISEI